MKIYGEDFITLIEGNFFIFGKSIICLFDEWKKS